MAFWANKKNVFIFYQKDFGMNIDFLNVFNCLFLSKI